MSRSTAKYLALLALAIVLFNWKTLLTDQYTMIVGSEGVNQSYAWLHFEIRSLWQGHLPLWDPYAWAGRPFAGEMQPAAYYPLQFLYALVPLNRNGLVSPRFYHEFQALTHLFGAWFMFALLRELRSSRFSAFVGACAFSLGGLLVRMIWPMYVESCIWLPAIFLFVLRALRADGRRKVLLESALAGLCFGMSILTGGMEFCILQGIFIVTAVFWYGAASPPDRDRRAHWSGIALILSTVLIVAAGAGAIQLLPEREYGRLAIRFIDGGPIAASEKIPYDRLVPGMWPQSIISGLFPTAFGGKFGGEEYFPYYIGVLPFFLALVAIWRRWNHVWVRYLTVLALLTFAYSLGEFSPLNGVLYAVVPYLWLARSANRFLYLISFALAILAALGLDVLLENTGQPYWSPAKGVLKWIAIATGAALLIPAIFVQLSLDAWTAFSLLLILVSCAWLAYLMVYPAGKWPRVALAAFILFDLSAFNWLPVDNNNLGKFGDEMAQMISLRGPSEFIRSQPGLERVRVGVSPEPNIGDVYEVQSAWGGGATALAEYSRLGVRDNLLNVRYYIRPASTRDPNPLYHDARWKVYENPKAFPRAWLVHKTRVEPSLDAVYQALDDPAIDLHQTALLDKPLPGTLESAGGATESVRFRSWEANRMAMDVDTPAAGLVVLSELYYPGWRATVNGKRAEIYKVDGALRGIRVPGGSSRVELEYAPVSFYAGATITALTFIGVLAGWILCSRRTAGS